ncbi:MAG: NACHT domain-containing protein [Cyanobacteria bacterium CRU_2_1]|nr:NACHT domain-containing protein [Cyanobacteria bacterium CRU_2_1]
MTNSLRASTEGLAIVDRARQRRGWTKTSTARWWQDAHTSRATLRRFWRSERIQQEIFIAICQVVGIDDWQAIAAPAEHSDPIPDPSSTPQLDWDDAPDLNQFYGRHQELAQLEQWMLSDRCKLIAIIGIAGIGKTALALALTDRTQSVFEWIIWRSFHTAPSLLQLLDSLLHTFSAHQTTDIARDIPQGIVQLMHHLRQYRCLLILDGLDAVLPPQPNHDDYTMFLQRLSHDRHQSCLLITSREKPQVIEAVEMNRSIRCLTLVGLRDTEALQFLQTSGQTNERALTALNRLYQGNPLALMLVMPLIQSVFGGNVSAFLEQDAVVVDNRFRSLIKQQLDRLSDLERDIAYWLAIWQEPISFCRLQTHLLASPDPVMLLEGIAGLERRSLLEKRFNSDQPSFTLQPLVMKIITDELVEQGTQEIIQVIQSSEIHHFKVIRTHWLLRPGTDDIAGDRILNQLQDKLWRISRNTLPQALWQILSLLNVHPPLTIGYASCNVTALLKQLDLDRE